MVEPSCCHAPCNLLWSKLEMFHFPFLLNLTNITVMFYNSYELDLRIKTEPNQTAKSCCVWLVYNVNYSTKGCTFNEPPYRLVTNRRGNPAEDVRAAFSTSHLQQRSDQPEPLQKQSEESEERRGEENRAHARWAQLSACNEKLRQGQRWGSREFFFLKFKSSKNQAKSLNAEMLMIWKMFSLNSY